MLNVRKLDHDVGLSVENWTNVRLQRWIECWKLDRQRRPAHPSCSLATTLPILYMFLLYAAIDFTSFSCAITDPQSLSIVHLYTLTVGVTFKSFFCEKDQCSMRGLGFRTLYYMPGALRTDSVSSCIEPYLFQHTKLCFFTAILSLDFSSLPVPLIFTVPNLMKRLFVLFNTMILLPRIWFLRHICCLLPSNCHWAL